MSMAAMQCDTVHIGNLARHAFSVVPAVSLGRAKHAPGHRLPENSRPLLDRDTSLLRAVPETLKVFCCHAEPFGVSDLPLFGLWGVCAAVWRLAAPAVNPA